MTSLLLTLFSSDIENCVKLFNMKINAQCQHKNSRFFTGQICALQALKCTGFQCQEQPVDSNTIYIPQLSPDFSSQYLD